jgi:hypothetical protein
MAMAKILIRAPQSPERRASARMTGRYLMTIEPDAHNAVSAKLTKAGFKAATPLPRIAMTANALPRGSQLGLRRIGVSLLDPHPEQEDALQSLAAQERGVLALEPERIVRTVGTQDSADYIRGLARCGGRARR